MHIQVSGRFSSPWSSFGIGWYQHIFAVQLLTRWLVWRSFGLIHRESRWVGLQPQSWCNGLAPPYFEAVASIFHAKLGWASFPICSPLQQTRSPLLLALLHIHLLLCLTLQGFAYRVLVKPKMLVLGTLLLNVWCWSIWLGKRENLFIKSYDLCFIKKFMTVKII